MAELVLLKGLSGLVPYNPESEEIIKNLKLGAIIQAKFNQPRNPQFHRKFMALLNLAFDHFEPKPIVYNEVAIVPEKNFEEFRRWVTIRAGFFDFIGYPNGTYRARAKSISFANMDEQEFSHLYSKAIDVLLEDVLNDYETYDQVESTVNKIIGFA
ncbi:DUF1367 family protein [Pseudoalteromonas sp. R3]|uniref:DUF1367 family protein n=1 Tax=Pseudoalteromonas sp. R3 TaxID=1709477 RepID=UPI0006B53479|nr:DUF1367 family protein [Pseudoalteromonas sp. R3]AZZ98773.1 DUF1367 family protein [Pseudoalteromonas sp. R3]